MMTCSFMMRTSYIYLELKCNNNKEGNTKYTKLKDLFDMQVQNKNIK